MVRLPLLSLSIGCVLLSSSRSARAEGTAPDLCALAKNHFTEFKSEAEKTAFDVFFKSVQEGKKADLTPDLKGVTESTDVPRLLNPLYGDDWGDSRVIKADWINWLCTDIEAAKKVTSKGIEIDEARISGKVDLSWLKLEFPIRIFKCRFTDDVILDRAAIRGLQMQSSYLKGFHGDGLNIDRDLAFEDHCVVQGTVWLQEATIGGNFTGSSTSFFGGQDYAINLKFAKIGTTVLFQNGFRSQGQVSLQDASIGATLRCDDGQFINPGGIALELQGAKTGMVFLRNGFRAEGAVWLLGANIGGNLECEGGQFINPGGIALELQGAKTGTVLLNGGFKAQGEVHLLGATIGGNLECDGGQFINPSGRALLVEKVKAGSVFLRSGFIAEGTVSLLGTTINGDLDCTGGHFFYPNKIALNAMLTKISGSAYLQNFEADGLITFEEAQIGNAFNLSSAFWHTQATLDLSSAKTKTLANYSSGWPSQNHLVLHAFAFDEIDSSVQLKADFQQVWIGLQPANHFMSQPYERMAKVLRDMGLSDEAVKVMIAKNKDYASHYGLRFMNVFWYMLFGPFIGYGYYWWNAFFASLAFIVFGWMLFHAGYCWGLVTPTGKDAYDKEESGKNELSEFYPRFDPFIFSLETFVPFLKLWMSDYWAPNATRHQPLKILRFGLPITGPRLRFYLWCHVAAGWVLTTLWVGGLTGLLKT